MKKPLLIPGACLLCMTMLLLSACRKSDLPCDPRNGNAEFTQCVIHEINNYPSGQGTEHHRTFTYNSKGDPVVGDPGDPATGNPRWVFYYDRKGRLVTFAGLYTGGFGFEFWHNYKYDSKDRIISDTVYSFGQVGNLGTGPGGWHHYQLFYDNLNRVIKQTITSSNPFETPYPFTGTFTYNAAGNLNGDGIAYDDKVNPLLTNKIWRFISRNYSVNNLASAASVYNENGFPTRYVGSFGEPFQIYGDQINIIYDCGNDHHGGY